MKPNSAEWQIDPEGAPRSLEEVEIDIKAHQEKMKELEAIQKALANELLFLEAEARAAAHLKFFQTYGEWDWIVRARYMELVKSLAHQWPWSDSTRGYAFELWNSIPHFPSGMMDENLQMRKPEFMVPYSVMSYRVTLTEFVKPENIEQCKLTPKIVDAFKLLKYLLPEELKERGFGISRKEEPWKNDDKGHPEDHGGPGFDYEGYKFHLVTDENTNANEATAAIEVEGIKHEDK